MKKSTYKPEKYDFYLKLMDVTLENVEQYSKDAILLRDNLSLGHAYSMAILGFEELAKCWFAFGLFIGEFEEDDEIAPKITRDHVTKQELGWQVLTGIIFSQWFEDTGNKSEVDKLVKQLQSGHISLEAYDRKLYDIVELESESLDSAKYVIQLNGVFEKLDSNERYMSKRKNEGFYVDFDLNKREIKSDPGKFILSDVVFIDTFVGFYQYSNELIKTIKENLKRKTMKEYLANMRKGFELLREIFQFEQGEN